MNDVGVFRDLVKRWSSPEEAVVAYRSRYHCGAQFAFDLTRYVAYLRHAPALSGRELLNAASRIIVGPDKRADLRLTPDAKYPNCLGGERVEEMLEVTVASAVPWQDACCSILYELTYYGFSSLFMRSIGATTPPLDSLPENVVRIVDAEDSHESPAVDSDVEAPPPLLRPPPSAIPKRRYSF